MGMCLWALHFCPFFSASVWDFFSLSIIVVCRWNSYRQNLNVVFCLQVMSEILRGIRVIKFYAWEGNFKEKINKLRSVVICWCLCAFFAFFIAVIKCTALLLCADLYMCRCLLNNGATGVLMFVFVHLKHAFMHCGKISLQTWWNVVFAKIIWKENLPLETVHTVSGSCSCSGIFVSVSVSFCPSFLSLHCCRVNSMGALSCLSRSFNICCLVFCLFVWLLGKLSCTAWKVASIWMRFVFICGQQHLSWFRS